MKGIHQMVSAVLGSAIIIAMTLAEGAISVAMACNYYASPNGGGNGSSPSSPFRISQFWAVARPGTTLCLLDGEYTGSSSMIKPPQNLRGTSSGRITIKALHDGKATINGQFSNMPVNLISNDYFILEGFNAHSSSRTVINLYKSHNNIIRRVAAWDAAEGNASNIFGVHEALYNLLEDVAGWGIARAVFSGSQGSNNTTFRRAWGNWSGSHHVGGKNLFQLAYNTYDVICENCVGQFAGESMKETYQLLGCTEALKETYAPCRQQPFTNYRIEHPGQIFHATRQKRDTCTGLKLLGSLAYALGTHRFQGGEAVLVAGLDCITIQDTVAVFQQGYFDNKRTFELGTLGPGGNDGGATNLIANRITGIGGSGLYLHPEWKQTGVNQGATLSAVPNPFTTTTGANLCYRYENGVRTTNPLWPWPMNQRIIEATAQSGRSPVNVTATIEKMLGSIPAACKGGSSATGSSSSPSAAAPLPSAPTNLQANP